MLELNENLLYNGHIEQRHLRRSIKMTEYKSNKRMDRIARITAILLCGGIFASTFYVYPKTTPKDENIMVSADEDKKEFKWTKCSIEEGTTVDADYLWPDETNAAFTAIYRDGKLLSENKMVTVTKGSVYHFRGSSDDSVLYTEVYIGNVSDTEILTGEAVTWYHLLPSTIRNSFEEDGWTWKTGWEYTGRAYLDTENKCVMIKDNDSTAVLYGVGLYLDNKYGYAKDEVIKLEEEQFKNSFGSTDNLFASALEYYYARGGELSSKCPGIYTMVADKIANLGDNEETAMNIDTSETVASVNEPKLMKEMLEYVNMQREHAGLPLVTWDDANDNNVIIRVNEISVFNSQTRPDGSDAFSAYTNEVMSEMRITDMHTVQEIYESAESYFLMDNLISFNCALYNNSSILIFTW